MNNEQQSDFSLEFLVGLLLSILSGFFISMVLVLLVMLLPVSSQAAESVEPLNHHLMSKNEVSSGSVLFRTDVPGQYRQAPVLKTDVDIRVSGMLVRTRVVQRFKNPGQEWLEGIYVFPLPEKAAVDRLKMRIGDRVIEGQIKEKIQAKKIYEQAKRQGRKAALVEQERANMFTNSIANIGPDEIISVEIEYQQTLHYDSGQFRLRFPLVVAPRYIPGARIDIDERVQGYSGSGWAHDTDQVTDASRITPPVANPQSGSLNPVTLRVDLDAGFPLDSLKSSYHKIDKQVLSETRMTLTLQEKNVPADRDFELVWQPQKGHMPRAALFNERNGSDFFSLLMVLPPDVEQTPLQVMPREVIYVIDTSGSMGGASIRQARQALQYAIKALKPGDYFNVIQFNSVTSRLFERAVPVDSANINKALAYVQSLNANGGTEMAAALNAALEQAEKREVVRQVVFLTDGSIGNEEALFAIIKNKLDNSRLFTVGIGSAPNSHFMSKAAQYGRGSYTYIGKIDEVDEKMSLLFRKIQNPVLSNIQVHWPDKTRVEMWPQRLPDLYTGEPLMLIARLSDQNGSVTIKGERAQQQWQVSLPLKSEQSSPGVAVLWAREKIASLMDRLREGVAADIIKTAVTDVALRYQLVSRYTSLVAVDVTPSRPQHDPLVSQALKVNLPAGWQQGKVLSSLPQTATDSFWNLLVGLLLIVLGSLLSLSFRRRSAHAA